MSIYLLTVGLMVGFDPLGAFSMYLATITRYMVMTSDFIVVLAIWIEKTEFRVVAGVVVAFTVFYIILCNKTMLRSENWTYSECIQHALIADPENETGESWKHWGKRECRSLYGQIGLPVDDATLESMARPVFYLVYLKTKRRFKDSDTETSKAVEQMTQQVMEMESTIHGLQEENNDLRYQVDKCESKLSDTRAGKYMVQSLEDELQKANEKIRQLEEANEYLYENPEQVVDVITKPNMDYLFMTEEQRIFECFNLGMKNKDIEKAFGKAKSTISDMKKRWLKSMEE